MDKEITRRFTTDVDVSHGFLTQKGTANARVLTLRVCYNQRSKLFARAELEQIAVRDSEAASAHYNRALGAAEEFQKVDLDAWPDHYELADRDLEPTPPADEGGFLDESAE